MPCINQPTAEWMEPAEGGSVHDPAWLKTCPPEVFSAPLVSNPVNDLHHTIMTVKGGFGTVNFDVFTTKRLDTNLEGTAWHVDIDEDRSCTMDLTYQGKRILSKPELDSSRNRFAGWWKLLGYEVSPTSVPMVLTAKKGDRSTDKIVAALRCVSRLEEILLSAEFQILRSLEGIIISLKHSVLQTATTQRSDVRIRGIMEHYSDALIGWFHCVSVLLLFHLLLPSLNIERDEMKDLFTSVVKGLESNLVLCRQMVASGWTKSCRVGADDLPTPPSWVQFVVKLPDHGKTSNPTKQIPDKGEAGLALSAHQASRGTSHRL